MMMTYLKSQFTALDFFFESPKIGKAKILQINVTANRTKSSCLTKCTQNYSWSSATAAEMENLLTREDKRCVRTHTHTHTHTHSHLEFTLYNGIRHYCMSGRDKVKGQALQVVVRVVSAQTGSSQDRVPCPAGRAWKTGGPQEKGMDRRRGRGPIHSLTRRRGEQRHPRKGMYAPHRAHKRPGKV